MPKINKFLFGAPRILSILFLLFLAMFSLDVFELCNGFLECALALFMHNIPVFILAILLWISWKREWVGTIAFFAIGLLYLFLILREMIRDGFEWYYLAWAIQISGIAFIVGILFWMGWKQKRKA